MHTVVNTSSNKLATLPIVPDRLIASSNGGGGGGGGGRKSIIFAESPVTCIALHIDDTPHPVENGSVLSQWPCGEVFTLCAGDLGISPRSSHTSHLIAGALVPTLPNAWRCRMSPGSDWLDQCQCTVPQ